MADNEIDPLAEMRLQNMRTMLRFLEDHIQRGYKDYDTLDNKARANIAAASLLLSFVTSFQLLGPAETYSAVESYPGGELAAVLRQGVKHAETSTSSPGEQEDQPVSEQHQPGPPPDRRSAARQMN